VLRFRAVLLVGACLVMAAALGGCGSQAGNAKALEAHDWKVVKLDSAVYSSPAEITLKFSAGKISGSTGVNSFGGTYEAPRANDITIKPGAMTLRAGTPDAMKAETNYIKALTGATSYAVDDQSLTLFDSSGLSMVEFAAAAQ
jgi:heat shock protein HslJ